MPGSHHDVPCGSGAASPAPAAWHVLRPDGRDVSWPAETLALAPRNILPGRQAGGYAADHQLHPA